MHNDFLQANDHSLQFYSDLISRSDNEHAIVAQSERSHIKRFRKILDLGDLQNKSILDIGCGLGGLFNFLNANGIKTDYHGIDINPGMIAMAKEKNPAISDHFQVFDIISNDLGRQFDYCVAIGILNLKFADGVNDEMNLKLMKQMAKHATRGFAVSMTSDLSTRPTGDTYYFNAGKILEQAKSITSIYKIDHSYLPNDFTIYCYIEDLFSL
jgi:SAM-dependent methyltransferase